MKADVELGGTDQKFNLLMGRKVQKRYGFAEQDVMMTPLVGVGRRKKMVNRQLHRSIRKPEDMFGKIMSIPDDLMVKYFLLLTDVSEEEFSN